MYTHNICFLWRNKKISILFSWKGTLSGSAFFDHLFLFFSEFSVTV